MKKWNEFYVARTLTESNVDELMVQAYETMSEPDKAKISRIMSSGTMLNSWKNTVATNIAKKRLINPQQVAAEMLDGIDSYLGSTVTSSSKNSQRIGQNATQRTAAGTPAGRPNEPRADYQGNNGRSQTLWGNKNAQSGEVPQQEIAAKRLNQYHHDVFDGSLATAPSSYKYVFIRTKNKLVYNPNYQG